MSFRRDMDEYIDQCLTEGVLPSAERVIQEVEVAGQQGAPRDGGTPAKFHAGPPGAGSIATFKDHDTPPRFKGADQRQFTAARFSEQNRATPPARFGSAARMENEEAELLQAVFDDLEDLDDLEEMSAAEAKAALKDDWKKTKRLNRKTGKLMPAKYTGRLVRESQEGSDDRGFSDEEVVGDDLLDLDQAIGEAVVARGIGAFGRKAPELAGKWAKRYGRFIRKSPVRASITPSVAGVGATGYYGHKEKKAAAAGDKKAMAKYAKRRKVATAVAALPIAAFGAKAAIAAGKHAKEGARLGKEIRTLKKGTKAAAASAGAGAGATSHIPGRAAKAAKEAKKAAATATKGGKKDAKYLTKLQDIRRGRGVMATGAGATAALVGTHYVNRTGKKWEQRDKQMQKRLAAGRKRRRTRSART